ncbi:MAG: SIMPL domain-containing protein [Candidatus Latescibacteria bacterium]|nr:SIMPL domain-containing protein [Candidatus Latescibacterota bacterium]
MNLTKHWIWSMAGALVLAGWPAIPAMGQPPALRQIAVSGEGQVRVRPDVARTSLGVRSDAPTVAQAMRQNRTAMQQVLGALRGLGIEERDIRTTQFSLNYDPPHPREKGGEEKGEYQVDNMVLVTIRDLEQVDAVLEQATQAGADQIWGLHFAVDQPDSAVAQARKLAAGQARAKAEQLAQLHGARLGPVISISEMDEHSGGPMLMEATMRDEGMTSAGDLSFGIRLQVVYGIE